jgi:uncharacterized protein
MGGGDDGRNTPLDKGEQARLFQSIEGVERAVRVHLQPIRSSVAVVHWIRQLQTNVDAVYDKHVKAGAQVQCQKGCGHCCHIRVEALPPEIFRITAYLRASWAANAEAGRLTMQRLTQHSAAVVAAATSKAKPPCPFLVDQVCSIYPIRPSVCRKGHSLDMQACQNHAPTLPQSLGLLADVEALIQGTSRAYADEGLQSGGYEMVAGVLLALQDDTAQARWLAGEAVFAAD